MRTANDQARENTRIPGCLSSPFACSRPGESRQAMAKGAAVVPVGAAYYLSDGRPAWLTFTEMKRGGCVSATPLATRANGR